MTEERLTEIEARANAATPGSWFNAERRWESEESSGFLMIVDDSETNELAGVMWSRDAAFIVHARADVPCLIDEVRRLQRALMLSNLSRGLPAGGIS